MVDFLDLMLLPSLDLQIQNPHDFLFLLSLPFRPRANPLLVELLCLSAHFLSLGLQFAGPFQLYLPGSFLYQFLGILAALMKDALLFYLEFVGELLADFIDSRG